MSGCIFCMIINGEIPAGIVYEDDDVIAINDINPQAPVHVLVMPKKHIPDIMSFYPADIDILGSVMNALEKVAEIKGINKTGFRVINNYGEDSGQTVGHVHFHIIGGRQMGEKIV